MEQEKSIDQQQSNMFNPVAIVKEPGCFYRICGGCIRAENAFKTFLERIFFKTPAGHYLEQLNSVLMLGSAILYVVLSTLAEEEGIYESEGFNQFDKAVCGLLLFLWLIKFYVSQNRKQYVKKTNSLGELIVALPIICIVVPDLFERHYLLIILSRNVRLIMATKALTGTTKLSSNAVSNTLYKMIINLTMLIIIAAFLFTGIENQSQLVEVYEACQFNRPTKCLDIASAGLDECI